MAWDVFIHRNGKLVWVDTVFHNACSAYEVYEGLVNHDGYSPSIVVRRG
jgi:hypothetical protein